MVIWVKLGLIEFFTWAKPAHGLCEICIGIQMTRVTQAMPVCEFFLNWVIYFGVFAHKIL